MSYAVTWTIYYLGGFLETNIGVSAVSVGTIMAINLWMRPVGGIFGGILADKVGKTNTLSGALIASALCLVIMAILPATAGKFIFYALVVIGGAFIYAIRGTYWSLLGDCNIDDKVVGVSVGFVSLLGYLPDIILPMFNSFLFNTFGGNGGYNAYFISSAIIGGIGAVLVFQFKRLSRKA
jgi:MFS family permease